MRAAPALLLAVLLAGCATVAEPPPEPVVPQIAIRFFCMDTNLFAEFKLDTVEGSFFSLVGRCLGDLRIIGRERMTET